MEEMEVPGLNTISELSELKIEPPQEIELELELIQDQQVIMDGWNIRYISIIPYCSKCKEPLVWHRRPNNGTLFHCPKCSRKWIKDKNWDKDDGDKNEQSKT